MTRLVVVTLVGIIFLCTAPLLLYEFHQFALVDDPRPSDVILVPAGDFALRTAQALALAQKGYGCAILVDEGSDSQTFGRTLADRRAAQLGESSTIAQVCPIRGETTWEESKEARICLQSSHPRRVLIVTSDFHTRRSLALFQKEMPDIQFSVSAVPTDYSRGPWWRIESIATSLEEWLALLMWKLQS